MPGTSSVRANELISRDFSNILARFFSRAQVEN
jgi:hypothetical protein